MGDVGNFLFGGSKQKSSNTSSGSSQSSSSNSSQNSSTQGSISNSSNNSGSASNSNGYNLSYAPVAAAMSPTLGMTAAGGNMLGALLGIPGYTATSGPAPASPAPYAYSPPPAATLPTPPASGGGQNNLINQLISAMKKVQPTPPSPPSSPVVTPVPSLPGASGQSPVGSGGGGIGDTDRTGYCVEVSTPILMADGALKDAEDLEIGDDLWTMHEDTLQFGKYPVTHKVIVHNEPLYKAVIDGKDLRGTPDHRVYVRGKWERLEDLGERDGTGSVVKLTVRDAHTYISNGIVSHNVKAISTHDPINQYPMMALGGPVAPNKPVIVGEHQPEMFVPQTPGTIIPTVPGMPADGRVPPPGSPPSPQMLRGPGGPLNGGLSLLRHPPKTPHGGFVTPSPVNSTPPSVPTVPPAPTTPPPSPVAPSAPVDPNPQGTALNTFFDSAGGKFLMDQGQDAINNNNSANGIFQSGATGKALEKFGTGLASTYLNDYISHILDFSKLGLGGASSMTGAGGVNNSNSSSYGYGNSGSVSLGGSQGTSSGSSTGTSTSYGTGSSSGNSKKGLIPVISQAAAAAAAGSGD